MATGVMSTCVTILSASIVLTMHDKRVPFLPRRIILTACAHCREMFGHANIFMLPEINSAREMFCWFYKKIIII